MNSARLGWAALALTALASSLRAQEVSHQDCSFELDGKGFESFFHDIDGDGRHELVTTLLSAKSGRREI